MKKLFVGALPKDPSEWSIRQYFSQYGEITELKMITDEVGVSKGFCFVTFDDVASSQQVLANYDNNMIDGKWIDVKPSQTEGFKPGDWYCPKCGDLVFAKRDACKMCGAENPSGGRSRPYW